MKLYNNFSDKYSERVVGLDILRAIAILFVVWQHGFYLVALIVPKQYLKYNFSIDGVSIFFVLSGYLIGNILMRIITDNGFTIKTLINFWIRRWFRTIPNYLFVLMFVLVCQILRFHNTGLFSFNYLFFLQNFSHPHPNFFPEAWSLCVEEWFYLLFPLVCFLLYTLLKNKTKSILYSAIIFLIIPLMLRIIKYELKIGIDDMDNEFRKIVIFRLDSIMYGVLAAYIYTNLHEIWIKLKYPFFISGIILLLLVKGVSHSFAQFYYPLHFNIESITVLFSLPFFSGIKTSGIKLIDAVITFISIISYSIYLLNLTPVQEILLPVTHQLFNTKEFSIEQNALLDLFLYWFYTFFGSYLLYTLFEKRMTKLRDKIKIH